MNSYTGLHAAFYDEIYAEKPYAAEARFVHELAGSPGGRLLDVACGTGRHARAFADLGYEVTGCDINEELLAVARAKEGDSIRFVQGDMRDLHVDGGPFDLVTCLFDSIGYPQDNDGVIAALSCLGAHASPGGSVVCELLHAPALLSGASASRVRRWDLGARGELVRISETQLDVERMVMDVSYELIVIGADSTPAERARETQSNRFFSAPEMRLLAAAAGLDVRALVPAYANGPISSDTFHLLLVAQPA